MSDTESASVERACRDCGRPFTVGAHERELLEWVAGQRGQEFIMPTRCTYCRQARRRNRAPVVDDGRVETITCSDCGEPFEFGGKDRSFWARNGWVAPNRCRPCRQSRRIRI